MATWLLLTSRMKRSYDVVGLRLERPIILKVHDQMDFAAVAEANTRPAALYYRSNSPESVFLVRLVMLIVLIIGCGGFANLANQLFMQEIARVLLHLPKP